MWKHIFRPIKGLGNWLWNNKGLSLTGKFIVSNFFFPMGLNLSGQSNLPINYAHSNPITTQYEQKYIQPNENFDTFKYNLNEWATKLSKNELSKNNLEKKTIVLDPGHCEEFPSKNAFEYKINLEVCEKLKPFLENLGYNVILTRTDHSAVNKDSIDYNKDGEINNKDDLIARIEFGKKNNADYFMSIHCNAFRSKSKSKASQKKASEKKGTEIYFYGLKNQKQENDKKINYNYNLKDIKIYSEKNMGFGKKMNGAFSKNNIETKVIGSDFIVLKENPAERSILIELGYLTNKEDREYIKSEEGQKHFVQAITNYFKEQKTLAQN